MLPFFKKMQQARRPRCTALVAAAGSSARMGGVNKLLELLDGVPVLVRTLTALQRAERVDDKGNPVWAEGVSQIIAQSPYGRAHGLSGWEGMVRFYETRQALELRLVRAMPFPTVIADASDHERAQRELAAFFGEA